MAESIIELAAERWPTKLDRLANGFYSIKDKTGKIVPFCMNKDQAEYLANRHGMDLILKARQKGFTTVIQLDMLDDCLFKANTSCGVIAHNLADAKSFFADKIKFAYDELPEEFKSEVAAAWEHEKEVKVDGVATQDSADSLKFSNGSSIRVGTSLRSGTLQKLHVSEYGKLCAKYPEKAREVKSGAFNTVQAGQSITVESTAEGHGGHFFELCEQAKRMAGKELTSLDFKFHFAPWYTSPEYVLSGPAIETIEHKEYFEKLESKGIELTRQQKAWYIKKSEQQGDDMLREYPSTPEEAFEASVEGAYFGTQMTKMRKEGRICKIPILDKAVYTTWDLGYNDMMAICFWQEAGMERRLIDYYENSGEGFGHYADVLRRKGYSYERHYMPHDADHHMLTVRATTRREEAQAAGIGPISVLDRIATEMAGIDASRAFMPQVWIDEERGDRIIKCLDNYRKEWDDKLGTWKSKARHDEFSHGYKAFETAAIRPAPTISKPIRTGMRVGIV